MHLPVTFILKYKPIQAGNSSFITGNSDRHMMIKRDYALCGLTVAIEYMYTYHAHARLLLPRWRQTGALLSCQTQCRTGEGRQSRPLTTSLRLWLEFS